MWLWGGMGYEESILSDCPCGVAMGEYCHRIIKGEG